MTETAQSELAPNIRNPDGQEHPVNYDRSVHHKDGTFSRIRVRIIENNDQKLMSYQAINPENGKEVKLGSVDWVHVFALPNHLPPNDLARRVEKYYIIKEKKARDKVKRSERIFSPFDEPLDLAS